MMKTVSKMPAMAMLAANAPAFFDRLYQYDWYSQPLERWVDAFALSQDASILELGCGPGNLSRYMARHYPKVTGVDQSQAMIDWAAKTSSPAQFKADDALNLSVENAHYDLVVSASLINVIKDTAGFLSEARRVLKKGGALSVLFPTPEFNAEFCERFIAKNALGFTQAGAMRLWSDKARQIDPDVLCQNFCTAGFKNTKVTPYLKGALAAVTAIKAA